MKTLRTTWPLIASVLLLLVMFRLFVPAFLSSSNLLDLTQQISVNAILAFGMTLVILSGGIDLSVGALLALTGDHEENPTLSLPCRAVFARGQRAVEVVGPVEALVEADGNNAVVYTVNDDVAQRRDITIASINDRYVAVTAGLDDASLVVGAGSVYLSDGAKVRVVR